MQDDKWEALKEELKRKFKVEDEHFEDLVVETADGPVVQGKAEIIIFPTPIGKVKLARESRPVVLDKKEFYSHQQGKAARIEYKFSDTEFSYKIKAYIWREDAAQISSGRASLSEAERDDLDDWKEIDAGNFSK